MSENSTKLNAAAYYSWQINTAVETEPSRPAKRTRVSLACQRCKSRKQKCDGARPGCEKCRHLGLTCQYVIPSARLPVGKDHYMKALEDRVAEMESLLAEKGLRDVGKDHWYYARSSHGIDDETSPIAASRPDGTVVVADGQAEQQEAEPVIEDHDHDHDHDHGIADEQRYQAEAMIDMLRDLSLDATGGYLGGTAHITIGRLVGSIVKGKNTARRSSAVSSVRDHLFPRTLGYDIAEPTDSAFSQIAPHLADRCLMGYLAHVSTRFPLIHSLKIKELHARRNSLDTAHEMFILHLTYAIGGRYLENTGEAGVFFPERHHSAALKLLDELLQLHDTRSVQALMLLAIYCLQAPQGPGAWTYVGLAIRIGIDLGLHRRTAAMNAQSLENELRKRIFWSCYNLDRQVSIPLGRPFAIADSDIDIPLPLDVDEETGDIDVLEEASKLQPTSAPQSSTTLSLFVQLTKLRRIESRIQQKIYGLDNTVEATDTEINAFLDQLSQWKSMIPLDSQHKSSSASRSSSTYERYMIEYYQCKRLLLFPQLTQPELRPQYLKECADACGGVCRTYKDLHQRESVGYSLMALQSVFMAGLTLIYCTWMDPALIFNSTINNDIHACSIVLFVITERWPGARKYRDTFEFLKQNVIDGIAEGKHLGPRRAILQLKSGLQSTIHNMQGDEDQQDECSYILTDMAGEHISLERKALFSWESPERNKSPPVMVRHHQHGRMADSLAPSPQPTYLSSYTYHKSFDIQNLEDGIEVPEVNDFLWDEFDTANLSEAARFR